MVGITNTILGASGPDKGIWDPNKHLTPLMPQMPGLISGDYECLPFAAYYNNNVNYAGFRCFDTDLRVDNVYCHSVANPSYPLTFGWGCSSRKSKLTALRLTSQTENNGLNRFQTRMPRKFDIQGSNNKINWTTITTIEETKAYSVRIWKIPNNSYYNYYRLYIYSSMGDNYLTFKYCIPYGVYEK